MTALFKACSHGVICDCFSRLVHTVQCVTVFLSLVHMVRCATVLFKAYSHGAMCDCII